MCSTFWVRSKVVKSKGKEKCSLDRLLNRSPVLMLHSFAFIAFIALLESHWDVCLEQGLVWE